MSKKISTLFILVLFSQLLFPQSYTLRGKVTNTSGESLAGASVYMPQIKLGAVCDINGRYEITSIPAGTYNLQVSCIGNHTKTITVEINANKKQDIELVPLVFQNREVVIEVNRAKERETPVAFTNINAKALEKVTNSQDAPLLLNGIPGVYAYSTDGVGNGESKLFVRGFDQGHVQVLINGIPTNDPESNAVYWSNWGAVSSAAGSIQIQRGAGSSLYGAGSFGGSFNIVTRDVSPNFGADVHVSIGDPSLFVGGGAIRSGLLFDNRFATSLSYDWKQGYGTRTGSYYQGANYYFSANIIPDEKSSVKVVLHAGPQEHSYQYSAPLAYFEKYGNEANPANFFPKGLLDRIPTGKTDKLSKLMNIDDEYRTIKDSKYMSLAHNFYHKPQLELHYQRDFTDNLSYRGTFFYSVGRGGGSSVNGQSNLSNAIYGADTTGYASGTSALQALDADGVIKDDQTGVDFVYTRFLNKAYQKISYSLHRQFGFITSADWKYNQNLNMVIGGEYRSWFADHPGYYTNLYGTKTYVDAQRYGYRVNGAYKSTFTRRSYQGDMKFGSSTNDVYYFNPFVDYDLLDQGGTYNAQYRNYIGETNQGTGFIQASYKLPEIGLNLVGSLQVVSYKYHLKENMPGESCVGDSSAAPTSGQEGKDADGYFYMKSNTGNHWFKFNLVDQTRTRTFLQPKVGFTYNVNEEVSTFANFSHVERLCDLGVWYNNGNPNKNAEDEKSNQYEIGASYSTQDYFLKLNLYLMTWENKTAQIQDVSKAGSDGYDRDGKKYELVGSAEDKGIEIEGAIKLDMFSKYLEGISVNVAFSAMDNKWTKVLDAVKKDLNGKRRVFDSGALDANGKVDTLFFDELTNSVNASVPFTTLSYGITYDYASFSAGINAITAMNFYAYDGGSYIATGGHYDYSTVNPKFINTYSDKLPTSTVFNFFAGYLFKFDPLTLNVTAQVMNIFNEEFFTSANRSGVLPGPTRAFRLNFALSY